MTDIFWNSVLTGTVLGASIIALSIQREIESRSKDIAHGLVIENDKADPHQAFSDSERQKRLLPFTLVIVAWNVGLLIFESQGVNQEDPAANVPMAELIQRVCLVVGWLYALVLAVLCRHYRLPNKWGWTLNVHLCTFYFVTFLGSTYSIGRTLLLPNDVESIYVVAMFSIWMVHADLLFVTATTRQGPPDIDIDGRRVQSVTSCSIFDRLTYLWVYSVIKLAQIGRELEDEDLPTLPKRNRTSVIFQKMRQSRGLKIARRLIHVNALPITIQLTAATVASVLRYAPPYMMNLILILLTSMENGDTKRDDISLATGYGYIAGLFTIIMIHEWIDMRIWHNGMIGDLTMRGALFMELYSKTLRKLNIVTSNEHLTNEAINKVDPNKSEKRNTRPIGSIVNLMSTDSMRVAMFSGVLHEIVRSPVELLVAIAFLYQLIGPSCFLGLLILFISLPLNQYAAKMLSTTQKGLMETRDRRIGVTNEIIQGIRQIKFFAWENRWSERINNQRLEELNQLRSIAVSRLAFNIIWQGSPLFVSVVSLWAYTALAGNQLTAATAFTALLVFEELRVALNVLPFWMADVTQVLVSLHRIDEYLKEDELKNVPLTDVNARNRIGFENATISWTFSAAHEERSRSSSPSNANKPFAIRDVTLEFPTSQLSIICGSTGSGKTLLMMGLLGEACIVSGRSYCFQSQVSEDITPDDADADISNDNWIVGDRIAYVAQNAWLQNASIRDNILFGLPYNQRRYNSVVAACALVQDLAQFSDGDQTEIGEKGITLSGGQKARVALARAVYSRAKHVLLDDVLSAVDAYTARHIYDQCIMGPLLAERTRILITHHVRLCINGASHVTVLENGDIQASGSPRDLAESNMLQEILHHEDEVVEHHASTASKRKTVGDPTVLPVLDPPQAVIEPDTQPKKLVEREKRAKGYVKAKLYIKYGKALGGWLFWTFFAIVFLSTRGLTIGSSFWIKKWTEDIHKTEHETTGSKGDGHDVDYYIRVYALLTLAQLFFNILRFAVVYYGSLRAGRLLFAEMLQHVFSAPLRFFDTTPVGRILNRFAKDIETVDSSLPNYIVEFFVALINVGSVLVLIGMTIPWLAVPLLMSLVLYCYLGKLFMNSGLQYRRLESINRSPVFTHFTETIAGVTTIRAFGKTKMFLLKMVDLADKNCRPGFNTWVINRWMTSTLSIISAFMTSLIALVCLLYPDQFPAAVAGLCMSYSLTFTIQVFDLIRRSASVQLSFNSVERVVEYTEIDQEAPAIILPRPSSTWPSEGCIEFNDLKARYAPDLETVLLGVSFKVNPKEKVGIVGRTGSGKSTIALSIFRFIEAYEGSITIDGIDIATIGTADLRSNMSIIPQDPTLFSGTLRSNLDPFNNFSDAEISLALKRVHLLPNEDDSDENSSTESGNVNCFYNLETLVSQGGHNFSQGQRQLLCLARALLQHRPILIMDEATASVDFRTDEAIQRTISTEFKDCTILCIAHRLLTVVEYDRILVLDQGRVVEFANPFELLRNTESKFYQMCKRSGEFNRLMTMARRKHQLVAID